MNWTEEDIWGWLVVSLMIHDHAKRMGWRA